MGRLGCREAVAAAAPRWDLTRKVVTVDRKGKPRILKWPNLLVWLCGVRYSFEGGLELPSGLPVRRVFGMSGPQKGCRVDCRRSCLEYWGPFSWTCSKDAFHAGRQMGDRREVGFSAT